MANRLEFQRELVKILGSENVYFQPPESLTMKYPAIVYERYNIKNGFADNDVYQHQHYYKVTVLDLDPDSEIVESMSKFKNARFSSHYVSDNINHDSFIVYY
jgi:hypothetical protein